MPISVGYAVRVDQTTSGNEWKAKISRDSSGKKEIVFFRRENKSSWMQKLQDITNNVISGEKAAQKYLSGQFMKTNGSQVWLNFNTTIRGQEFGDALSNHIQNIKKNQITHVVRQTTARAEFKPNEDYKPNLIKLTLDNTDKR